MVDGNDNLAFDNCSTHNIQIFLALRMIPWYFIELGNCNDLKSSKKGVFCKKFAEALIFSRMEDKT